MNVCVLGKVEEFVIVGPLQLSSLMDRGCGMNRPKTEEDSLTFYLLQDMGYNLHFKCAYLDYQDLMTLYLIHSMSSVHVC